MSRTRSGPVLAVLALLALLVGLWFWLSGEPADPIDGTELSAEEGPAALEEPELPRHPRALPMGLESEPVAADIVLMPRPRIDIVFPESDVVTEETTGPLYFPAEPEDLILLVEKAMRDVLAALCRRADECCPGEGLCDLQVLEMMPMDEVAVDMVKKGGEGARLDEQALDDCLVALREFPCEANLDGASRARCREDEDGERNCDEVPGKSTIPASCRRLVRGNSAAGESCEEDQICGGDAVCVKVRRVQEQGTCRALAGRSEPCTWSAGCQGKMFCVRGTCSPPRGAGQVCDGAQPWCRRGRCRVGTCAFGLSCLDGLCAPQGRQGGSCRMEEDCVRGMICDPEEGCRWPGEEERANYPGVDPDEELPLCTMFRRMNEERRGE